MSADILAVTDADSATRLAAEGSQLIDVRGQPNTAPLPPLDDARRTGWLLILADSLQAARAVARRLPCGSAVLAVRDPSWPD